MLPASAGSGTAVIATCHAQWLLRPTSGRQLGVGTLAKATMGSNP